ncbi:MAG: hydroxyethylthiazole kinase [Hyphomicrobiales bacterium]|nr:hydroxyethylthiazole kinase [Hyphomicrobiales bacterium]
MNGRPAITPEIVAGCLAALRERKPRVHCITNTVAQAFTANCLLALGAVPSMTIAPEEIPDFVASADALLVNLGTFDRERQNAVKTAIEVAGEEGRPWVLDPVFVEASRSRAEFAAELARRDPAVIRLNEDEYRVLAGDMEGAASIADFAVRMLSVVALTGPADMITDGTRLITVANGHPFMGRVTAVGCASSAVVAAFLAVEPDALNAAAAAFAVMGIAGEIAGESAYGPGTFAARLIDALYDLDSGAIEERAKIV